MFTTDITLNHTISITIFDLLIIWIIESLFFTFLSQKRSKKEFLGIILLINSLKIGIMGLIWISNMFTGLYFSYAFISACLLILGYFISTLIYEREFILERKDASIFAFQISIFSSVIWFFVSTFAYSASNDFRYNIFRYFAEKIALFMVESNPDVYIVGTTFSESSNDQRYYYDYLVNDLINLISSSILFIIISIIIIYYAVKVIKKHSKKEFTV